MPGAKREGGASKGEACRMGPEDGIRMMAPPRLALNAAQWVSVGRERQAAGGEAQCAQCPALSHELRGLGAKREGGASKGEACRMGPEDGLGPLFVPQRRRGERVTQRFGVKPAPPPKRQLTRRSAAAREAPKPPGRARCSAVAGSRVLRSTLPNEAR